MSLFENTSFETYLLSLIPVIIYVVKTTIDNYGITELEKLRLSNLKKFSISLLKYVAFSLVFLVFIYLVIIFAKIPFEFDDERAIYVLLAIYFITFIGAMFLFEKIISFIATILTFQYDYYIVDQNGDPLCKIIKLSSNNTLLVESDGIEEFLDVKENRRYKKIRRNNYLLSKMYNSKKMPYVLKGLPALCIVLVVSLFFTRTWFQFCLYLTLIFNVLISLVLTLNFLEYKRYIKEQEQEQESERDVENNIG
ncbi:low affinity Fe/Cu permease [Lysinibacillus parviboronicapiens]|uniref:Low affinity Fe/Cu permease n=1 Tax=Lysinibacillus parviboronicapiens TaxID=436516 RepID=A0ABV2PRC3_9BACI